MKPLPYHEKNIEVGQQLCFGEIKKLDQFHPETCFSGKFEKARSLVIDFNPDSWSVFFLKKNDRLFVLCENSSRSENWTNHKLI